MAEKEEIERIKQLVDRARAFLKEASVCIDEVDLRLNKMTGK